MAIDLSRSLVSRTISQHPPKATGDISARVMLLVSIACLVVAGLVAYHNSFSVPFLFDDRTSIEENRTIRYLCPPWQAFAPPLADGMTVSGRPLLNFTLAVNYAISGVDVRSYHVANLAIHIAAALTLFGVVRRTLLLPRQRARFARNATPLAFLIALLWMVHPLQTESVTYVIQRAESLVSLFYLLTLYCFIRSIDGTTPRRWQILAVLACMCGMASKEVMVAAPIMVLLYDRTFVAGTFRESWRQRRWLNVALCGSWVLLGVLVVGTAGRGGTAGLNANVAWWQYAFTQCGAIVHYLRLTLWPYPLIFDYGLGVASSVGEVAWQILVVGALVVCTSIALWRRPVFGFLGTAFFAVLAPSSSVVPVATQTVAEHRMYLALAPVIVLIVLGLYAIVRRQAVVMAIGCAAAVLLSWRTIERNKTYQSEIALWQDTVVKRPQNARAHSVLGKVLDELGRTDEALKELNEALRLGPPLPAAHYNLGLIHSRLGRRDVARAHYEAAVKIDPQFINARLNLGVALMEEGRIAEAVSHLETAVRLAPDFAEAHCNLGNALAQTGQLPKAMHHFETALRLDPDSAPVHYNYGNGLFQTRRMEEAAEQYRAAAELDLNHVAARYNLGVVLMQLNRLPEATRQFEEALRLQPDLPAARGMLESLRKTGAANAK